MSITTALSDSFHEGGWPMYPVLILGTLLVIAAVRYATTAERRHLPVLRNLNFVTLTFGVLGSVLGMIHCLNAMSQVPNELVVKISLLGLGESINNLALALLMMVLAGLFTTVGALRASDREQSNP